MLHNSKIVGLQLRHFDRDKLEYEDVTIYEDFPTGKIKVLLSELYEEKIKSLSEKFEKL